MEEEHNCPKCSEPTESGASFCGNCGFRLMPQNIQDSNAQSADLNTDIPVYAKPKSHHKKHWAALALVFGVMGIAASFLLPFLGITLGVVGIVLISSSFSISRGWVKPSGLVISLLAVVVGLGFWVNTAVHDPKIHASQVAGTSGGIATISVSTPCYSIKFSTVVNIDNSKGSCSVNAYNGDNFQSSSDIYKIVASTVNNVNSSNFDSISKAAIAQDISEHLPGFTVSNQGTDLFNGNPAYLVYAYNQSSNVSMVEESILNPSPSSTSANNFFVVVHAVNGQNVSLNSLKKGWQWNE